MYTLLSICSNDSTSGKIYRELFEPDLINVFLHAYNAYFRKTESKRIISKIREQFSNWNGKKIVSKSSLIESCDEYDYSVGTRIFSKLPLHVIDKIIQRKFDQTWQRKATEEFESDEKNNHALKNLEIIVEKELKMFEDMLLLESIRGVDHTAN